MKLTITEAAYANEQGTGVMLRTVERGAVAISREDRPDIWRLMLLWQKDGGVIEPFTPPADWVHRAVGGRPREATPEKKLKGFLMRNQDVARLLRSKGIALADLE